jgi:hypothetical protein
MLFEDFIQGLIMPDAIEPLGDLAAKDAICPHLQICKSSRAAIAGDPARFPPS